MAACDETTNLLEETREKLHEVYKTPNDVLWVGSRSVHFTWDDFVKIADFEYDPGYGALGVASDLLIVGDTWWLERAEYDGSEWWELKEYPKKPDKYEVPENLKERIGDGEPAKRGVDW